MHSRLTPTNSADRSLSRSNEQPTSFDPASRRSDRRGRRLTKVVSVVTRARRPASKGDGLRLARSPRWSARRSRPRARPPACGDVPGGCEGSRSRFRLLAQPARSRRLDGLVAATTTCAADKRARLQWPGRGSHPGSSSSGGLGALGPVVLEPANFRAQAIMLLA